MVEKKASEEDLEKRAEFLQSVTMQMEALREIIKEIRKSKSIHPRRKEGLIKTVRHMIECGRDVESAIDNKVSANIVNNLLNMEWWKGEALHDLRGTGEDKIWQKIIALYYKQKDRIAKQLDEVI